MPREFGEITLVTHLAEKDVLAPRAADRQGTLTVLIGAEVGAVFTLGSSATLIGRSPNAHVTLQDDGSSRNHARILHHDGIHELEDLGSTNGTFVNGERATGRVLLNEGARIHIGNTVLRFALQDQLERDAARRMYEMSVRDGLTGVFNRRYLDERITSEFAFANRHASPLCVLLVDIDRFKRINDELGHQAGDVVLRRVAAELRNGIRTEDVIARYGGEEFAIMARGIDVQGARQFADRVRGMVERAHIVWEGKPVLVTVSIGLAHNHAGAAATRPEQLVGAADVALYQAKETGRNRVVVAVSPGRYSSSEGKEERTLPERPSRSRYWEQATRRHDERAGPMQGPSTSMRDKRNR